MGVSRFYWAWKRSSLTPAQGVEDVVPGIVNPGGPPLPSADMSADGHPKKKKKKNIDSLGGKLFWRLNLAPVFSSSNFELIVMNNLSKYPGLSPSVAVYANAPLFI